MAEKGDSREPQTTDELLNRHLALSQRVDMETKLAVFVLTLAYEVAETPDKAAGICREWYSWAGGDTSRKEWLDRILDDFVNRRA